MFKRIIVLPQGNGLEQPAIERAALCASKATTEITVLEVFYEQALEGYLGNTEIYEPLRKRVLAERQERAASLAATLAARGLRAVGKAVWAASREEAIEQLPAAGQIDLVVAAPLDGGRGGLSSSDWRLLSKCRAPVLMVRGAQPRRQYRNIVAAVDPFHAHAKPAELDTAILEAASKLKSQTGASLTVLHCYGPPEFFRADARLAPRDDEFEKTRRDVLEDLLTRGRIPSSAAKAIAGEPHAVLQEMAESGAADVIVMGALARGRLKDWVIGSTAERVLHRTQVDVLAIHPSQ
ncbi:MAG TPA: universal stress protein [Gammaproteobacteria bacterium]|jgi:nucleotide-binding universal stress UspA family protein|nr:universal stress protein [Gammaproteobacteria bacterium]